MTHIFGAFMVFLLISAPASWATESQDLYSLQSAEQRSAFIQLTEELRCPKCQNQNLADSDSQIAETMRTVIAEQLHNGASSAEIKDLMVGRYGKFVLYKPPVSRETALLWWGPIVLFAVAGFAFFMIVLRRKTTEFADDDIDT